MKQEISIYLFTAGKICNIIHIFSSTINYKLWDDIMIKYKILFIILLLTATLEAHALTTREALDSCVKFARYLQDSTNIPGMQMTIIKNGVLIYSGTFGYSNITSKTPVKPYTKFRIASVSKVITAITAMKLLEYRKLSLDSTIQAYYPKYPRTRYPITVRNLLSHTSGIRHYEGDEFSNPKHYKTMEQFLNTFKYDSLLFEPGTTSKYSSYGYLVMGVIIEKLTGMKFQDYVAKVLTKPLNMTRTMPDNPNKNIPFRTEFYMKDGESVVRRCPTYDVSYKIPTGGYLSTSYDIASMVSKFLEGKVVNDSIEKIYLTPVRLRNGKEAFWTPGLRWTKLNKKALAYWQLGSSYGCSSAVAFSPEHKTVVCWITNMNINWSEHPVLKILRYIEDAE